jgi:aminoglycoside/choline kinase family phosphotransferase
MDTLISLIFREEEKVPFYYDLASFLWQASAKYSFKLRRELVSEYYDSLKNYMEVPTERHFVERLSLFVLFRTLQVLGAYGFRGYFERKKHFLDSIPPAMDNLRELLKLRKFFPYPYLMDMLKRLTELAQFAPVEKTNFDKGRRLQGIG